MIFSKIGTAVLFAVFCILCGCSLFRGNTDKFTVTIKFADENRREKLEDVRIIIGSDKFWWNFFENNEEKTASLYSEKNAVNNITLLYKIGGSEKIWESENFAKNTDYKITLNIDGAGIVTHNFCKIPC